MASWNETAVCACCNRRRPLAVLHTHWGYWVCDDLAECNRVVRWRERLTDRLRHICRGAA